MENAKIIETIVGITLLATVFAIGLARAYVTAKK